MTARVQISILVDASPGHVGRDIAQPASPRPIYAMTSAQQKELIERDRPAAATSTCIRCERPLTNPRSIRRGMGQVCFSKTGGVVGGASGGNDYSDRYLDVDLEEGGLIMNRPDGEEKGKPPVETNVPHLVEQHSPSGFEFGYGGSGPADLALNVTMIVLNRVADEKGIELEGSVDLESGSVSRPVWRSYQEFKSRFVAPCPRDGGRVPWETLREWAEEKLTEIT